MLNKILFYLDQQLFFSLLRTTQIHWPQEIVKTEKKGNALQYNLDLALNCSYFV